MKLGTVRQAVLRAQMLVHIRCEILYMDSENTRRFRKVKIHHV
jgi:hypothetical protein